jgi:hypothetical protein
MNTNCTHIASIALASAAFTSGTNHSQAFGSLVGASRRAAVEQARISGVSAAKGRGHMVKTGEIPKMASGTSTVDSTELNTSENDGEVSQVTMPHADTDLANDQLYHIVNAGGAAAIDATVDSSGVAPATRVIATTHTDQSKAVVDVVSDGIVGTGGASDAGGGVSEAEVGQGGGAPTGHTTSRIGPDDLECPLCLRLLHLPVTTTCGHSFCSHCLCQAAVAASKTRGEAKCPICRAVRHTAWAHSASLLDSLR